MSFGPAPIPVVDVRDGGALRFAQDGAARARALREDCVAWFPGFVRPLVPLIDRAVRLTRLPLVRGLVDDGLTLVRSLRGV